MSGAAGPAGPPPLVKTVVVPGAPALVFAHFTERFGDWWPRAAGHSVFADRSASCALEGRVGGAIVEMSRDGARAVWGRITAWEPPHRLAFSWFPGRGEDTAQTVEVRFAPAEGGTRLVLEHRDWHRLGDKAAATRANYDRGWEPVLGGFGAHAGRLAVVTPHHGAAGDGRRARFSLAIAAAPEIVFRHLATAAGLDAWFTDGAALEPVPGGALAFRWRSVLPGGAVLEFRGRVIEHAPPRRFAFRWQADSGLYDATCEIDLAADGGGTRVALVEHGFRDDAIGLQDLLNRQSGWAQQLTRLKVFLEHGIRV
jgi:uncharacterized protein YndB with AHSA1/START domain